MSTIFIALAGRNFILTIHFSDVGNILSPFIPEIYYSLAEGGGLNEYLRCVRSKFSD
jgi:hypothetical protein